METGKGLGAWEQDFGPAPWQSHPLGSPQEWPGPPRPPHEWLILPPKSGQWRPKSGQECPKSGPERLKTVQEAPMETPKLTRMTIVSRKTHVAKFMEQLEETLYFSIPVRPKSPQDVPKYSQDGPRALQRPKCALRAFITFPRSVLTTPRAS